MKAISTLLLLLVFTGLYGQTKKNTTFKIKKIQPIIYMAAIDSDYWDSAFSIVQLLHTGKLQLVGNFEDSIRITGFTLAMGTLSGSFIELSSPNDSLTAEMNTRIKEEVDGSWLIFKSIKCITKGRQTFFVNGLALKIYSKHKITHRNLHYPILITTIPGLWEGIVNYSKDTISKAKLIQIGRLEAKGEGSDSSKILDFNLEIGPFDTYSYKSTNEYLTKEMIAHIKLLPKGSYIIFKNVRYQLSSGIIKFAADLPLILTE